MINTTRIDVRPRSTSNWKEYSAATRVYIFPKGETLMDNLINRKQRPYTTYKKEVMPAVLEAMGLPSNTKIRWSQYAGCSCPCSPGFIVEGDSRRDVFVDVE